MLNSFSQYILAGYYVHSLMHFLRTILEAPSSIDLDLNAYETLAPTMRQSRNSEGYFPSPDAPGS